MSISRKIAAAAIAATTIVGAGAYAWAEDGSSAASGSNTSSASSPSSASSADPTASAAADAGAASAGKGRAGVMRRVEHGDLIVRTKDGFQPVTFDRGKVTAASSGSVTVQRPDGQSVTVTIDGSTKFRGVGSAADLQVGKPAVLLSRDGKALTVGQKA